MEKYEFRESQKKKKYLKIFQTLVEKVTNFVYLTQKYREFLQSKVEKLKMS